MVADKLLRDALALPAHERAELAERLWESVHNDPDAFPLTEAQKQMLDERLLDMERNPDDQSPADEVIARLRAAR